MAILLSKLYFYLNEYDEALSYALRAGEYFDVTTNDEFTEILVNKCIEKYIQACKEGDSKEYKNIVTRMIDNSLEKGDNRLVLGISLQTSDIPLFGRVSQKMDYHELVECLLQHLISLPPAFKTHILAEMVANLPADLSKATPSQYISLLQMLYVKGDFEIVAKIIYDCVKRNEREISYTLALEVA